MTISAYPLAWPVGWKRSPVREHGRFGKKVTQRGTTWARTEDLTVAEATQRVLDELRRMGKTRDDVVISTNLVLRLDGLPRSDQRQPDDPSVAVYWQTKDGGHKVMAIDRYHKVADNLAAVAATLEAMRAIERHGGAAILERAFTGFVALPAPRAAAAPRHWRDVLGVPNTVQTEQSLKEAYRRASSAAHPDKPGGSNDAMAAVNAAYEHAKQELGYA
jgi:hypothetical protein